ncbi:hypothetical protein [Lentzea xinjiangensis]|uniref:hypothetical protein n=1 Tax=Lentzea xinjiangensis TaxID=402600 RepID=UPI0015A6F3D0|nr:hypothetical protein [Lentzea xinjiangensis]
MRARGSAPDPEQDECGGKQKKLRSGSVSAEEDATASAVGVVNGEDGQPSEAVMI